jgi:hypothetical protein
MKLSIKSLAITCAIFGGAMIFLMGLGNAIWPGYGVAFLEVAASVYPGYSIGGFGSVIVGTLYAAVDGAIAGAIFAWLYNKLAP